eukprot:358811-Chlamydomonas_euryale.AAC.11
MRAALPPCNAISGAEPNSGAEGAATGPNPDLPAQQGLVPPSPTPPPPPEHERDLVIPIAVRSCRDVARSAAESRCLNRRLRVAAWPDEQDAATNHHTASIAPPARFCRCRTVSVVPQQHCCIVLHVQSWSFTPSPWTAPELLSPMAFTVNDRVGMYRLEDMPVTRNAMPQGMNLDPARTTILHACRR